MKTIISVLLDRSGSMSGLEKDVIGGINNFITEQQKDAGEDTLTLARFDTGGLEIFRPRCKVADAKHITAMDFQPRGGTPLLDCLGRLINQMDEDWKAESPERAICVVFTDGQENASAEFTASKIKEMIKSREDSGKWAFIYMGAHADAFTEAGAYGFNLANTARAANTAAGTATAYSAMSGTVSMMKATGATRAVNLGDLTGGAGTPQVLAAGANPPPTPKWTPPSSAAASASPTPTWTPPA